MIKSLWIAKTGLEANQSAMDTISHNLANANTSGFKRSRAVFEDLIYQQVKAPGTATAAGAEAPSGLQVGTGVRQVANVRNHTQGNLNSTGNPMDLAIQGAGFFAVENTDGTPAYTRDGSFQLNGEGFVVTANGNKVVPNIQVPAGSTEFTVAQDGTVTVKQPGATGAESIGQITLVNFINPAGLNAVGNNLLTETTASGAPQEVVAGTEGAGTIGQGFVESSNVNVVEELVSMIQSQRAYEINSKAVQAADQMLQRISQI